MTKEEMNRYEEGLRLRVKIETLENNIKRNNKYLEIVYPYNYAEFIIFDTGDNGERSDVKERIKLSEEETNEVIEIIKRRNDIDREEILKLEKEFEIL